MATYQFTLSSPKGLPPVFRISYEITLHAFFMKAHMWEYIVFLQTVTSLKYNSKQMDRIFFKGLFVSIGKERRRDRNIFHALFTPQIRAELIQSQKSLWVSLYVGAKSQGFGSSLAAFLDHKQGARQEVKQTQTDVYMGCQCLKVGVLAS